MNRTVDVLVQRLDPDVPLPHRAHPGDAGWDLVTTEELTLQPGQRALVSTGLAIALPAGYFAAVVPRSGLAVRHGVSMVNAPGTIDAGYRGEIRVNLVNLDPQDPVKFHRMDRIAQLIVQEVPPVRLHEVELLPGSQRSGGGFGSTGSHSGGTETGGPMTTRSTQ